MKKVQISIDDDLLERVDNYAESNYMSRSGLITVACNQYLNQFEVVLAIKDLSLAMQKIAKDKAVDEDLIEQLEDFERVSRMLLEK